MTTPTPYPLPHGKFVTTVNMLIALLRFLLNYCLFIVFIIIKSLKVSENIGWYRSRLIRIRVEGGGGWSCSYSGWIKYTTIPIDRMQIIALCLKNAKLLEHKRQLVTFYVLSKQCVNRRQITLSTFNLQCWLFLVIHIAEILTTWR